MSKIWPSPIFEKNSFPAENARNMPEISWSENFAISSYEVLLFSKLRKRNYLVSFDSEFSDHGSDLFPDQDKISDRLVYNMHSGVG